MNVRRWLREHSLKILAIRDTPGAIAGGVAIGVFFGFVPLFGFKTVLALFCAWLTRSNLVATFVAATAHEILFPLMPVIYLWDYELGSWVLNNPHHWPVSPSGFKFSAHDWWTWATLKRIGLPTLIGSFVTSSPMALVSFFVTHTLVSRHQRKKQRALEAETGAENIDAP
jgi:uncharacterized protein (DUF2062 family)